MLVRFHGYLSDIIILGAGVPRASRVFGEDGERFLQFDQLPVENVMSHNQQRRPLVDKQRTAGFRQNFDL